MNWAVVILLSFLGATLNYHNAEDFAQRTLAVQAGRERLKVEVAGEKYASQMRFLQKFELQTYSVLAPGVKDVPPGVTIPPWAYEIDYSEIGPILQTKLRVSQTLTTFGKISHLIKAAQKKRESAEAELRRIEREVAKNLKILVVDYSSLRDLRSLLRDVENNMGEVLKKVEKENPQLSLVDKNKLKAFFHATKAKLAEVDESIKGIESGVDVLLNEKTKIEPLEFYPEDVTDKWIQEKEPDFSSDPQVDALRAQVKALKEAYLAERAEYFPQILLSGEVKFSYAPLWPKEYVSCTLNPNCFSYGAGLVIGVNLNYAATYRKVQEARARWKAAEKALQAKIQELKLKWLKHYYSAVGLWKSYLEMVKGLKFARRNVTSVMLNFDMGVMDADEIVDAYSKYISLKAEVIKKKYQLVRELTEMWYYDGKRYLR